LTGDGPAPGTQQGSSWTLLLVMAGAIGGVVAIVAGIMVAAAAPSAGPVRVSSAARSHRTATPTPLPSATPAPSASATPSATLSQPTATLSQPTATLSPTPSSSATATPTPTS